LLLLVLLLWSDSYDSGNGKWKRRRRLHKAQKKLRKNRCNKRTGHAHTSPHTCTYHMRKGTIAGHHKRLPHSEKEGISGDLKLFKKTFKSRPTTFL